ncbi:MAG: hypothetical protein ACFCBU_08890 [Cyanophyceae cyanobacterium]
MSVVNADIVRQDCFCHCLGGHRLLGPADRDWGTVGKRSPGDRPLSQALERNFYRLGVLKLGSAPEKGSTNGWILQHREAFTANRSSPTITGCPNACSENAYSG